LQSVKTHRDASGSCSAVNRCETRGSEEGQVVITQPMRCAANMCIGRRWKPQAWSDPCLIRSGAWNDRDLALPAGRSCGQTIPRALCMPFRNKPALGLGDFLFAPTLHEPTGSGHAAETDSIGRVRITPCRQSVVEPSAFQHAVGEYFGAYFLNGQYTSYS